MRDTPPDKIKAAVALAAPIVLVGFIVISLLSQGYTIAEFPSIFVDGRLNLFEQIFGPLCIVAWIALYWPSALSALRADCMIQDRGDEFWLPTLCKAVKKRDIMDVEYHPFALRKKIVFTTKQGAKIEQVALFISGDLYELVRSMKNSVPG